MKTGHLFADAAARYCGCGVSKEVAFCSYRSARLIAVLPPILKVTFAAMAISWTL